MRRILSVLSAAALMAAMLVMLQAPAMAQSFRFDDDDFFDNGFFNNGFDRFDGFDRFGGFDQDIDETGDVNISTRVSGPGNNSNQCVAPLQFGNTGSLQNDQGFSSFGNGFNNRFNNDFDNDFFNRRNFFNGFGGRNIDDVEFEGSSFEFNPQQNVSCNQQVQQSAAASSR